MSREPLQNLSAGAGLPMPSAQVAHPETSGTQQMRAAVMNRSNMTTSVGSNRFRPIRTAGLSKDSIPPGGGNRDGDYWPFLGTSCCSSERYRSSDSRGYSG